MDARSRATDRPSPSRSTPDRTRRRRRPQVESLEGRALLATLFDIGPQTVPAGLGLQVPLDGGAGNPQTYTVASNNPDLTATIAQGNFLTIEVTHESSGANDPSFVGEMTFQLFEDLTPETVGKIEQLVEQGFYIQPTNPATFPHKNFHRITGNFPGAQDYILQGGSVNGTGSGEVNQPGFPFADEFVQQLAFTGKGQLAMANAGDDTNSSQFFITTGSPRFLDFQHTIFGQLVSGQETVELMTQVARNGETPINPILFTKTTLSATNPDGVVHVDATTAEPGETATITVTATDPSDNTTVSRTFTVTANQNTTAQRPFLKPVQNQVVGLVNTTTPVQGQTAVFQIEGVDPNVPPRGMTYVVQGGISGTTFTAVQNATASVNANGVVTVTPTAGFTGVINLVVGVGGPSANTSTVGDFDTQRITLTVTNGQPVNLQPIANDATVSVVTGQPNAVQLSGLTANPQSQQTLTYAILTNPTNGTITEFDPATGTFLYTPNAGFIGGDELTFQVTDVGAPTPNLTSEPATLTINVGGGTTGAVRIIGDVLVVTPPPSRNSVPNTIEVKQVAGDLQVVFNGLLDSLQPESEDIGRIVIYGSKKDDVVNVSTDVLQPTLISGGQAGNNILAGGGGPMRAHAWFGRNTVTGGPVKDIIYGAQGRFRVNPSAGQDLVFAGLAGQRATLHAQGSPPGGQFFQLRDGRLIPIATPASNAMLIRRTDVTTRIAQRMNGLGSK